MKRTRLGLLGLLGLLGFTLACSHPNELPVRTEPTRPPAATRSAEPPLCPPVNRSEPPVLLDGAPLIALCHGVYADPATTPEERDAMRRWYTASLAGLASVFGPPKADPPDVVSCKTEACELHWKRTLELFSETLG